MAIEYIGRDETAGVVLGQSGAKVGFFGITTPVTKPTAVATVDTTTITVLQVATATITHCIAANNSLIADMRLHALAINRILSRLQSLGLFA